MLTIDFSSRGTSSLTKHLYNHIKIMIQQRKLLPNEKLPSKRTLACHLGISVITVKNAYEQLICEGYIYSAEKKGYFVTPLEPKVTQKTQPLTYDSTCKEELENTVPEVKINLKGNAICPEQFPFSLWASLLRKSLQESKEKLLSPLPPQGIIELRKAICRHLNRFRNMDIKSHQIVIGAGTEYLYSLIVQLLGRNLNYGVENPGHTKTYSIFKANGAPCIPLFLDGSGVEKKTLEQNNIDVVHLSPAHHFPTGIIMPIKRRLELLAWAKEKDNRFIIEDDYDSEFRFSGPPLETLFSMADSQKVIYLNTFTKTIAPSLRISYMVLPLNLLEKFNQQLGFYSCTVSSIEQMTLARFIDEGYYEKHLIRMKNYYRNLRNSLTTELNKFSINQDMSVLEKDAGLHFLLKVKTEKTDIQLAEFYRTQGLLVAFLSEYFQNFTQQKLNKKENGVMVINYSSLKKEQIAEAVQILHLPLSAKQEI
ncbi:MAG: PLP-dependent aminotransferase family protein [Spirochaetaceae bacterium]|nr:PLP-dependent aminotransferase family protein [Spirochaetaceae bacterium]